MGESNNVGNASIEISNLTKLLAECHESPPFSSCISKVPGRVRNEKVFGPNVISIGPLHHLKQRLVPMEKIKLCYLHCLRDRFPQPRGKTLKDFVQSIGELQKRARESYAEPITNLNNNKFIEMMVVDGCFLIELFRKYASLACRHIDDPIFNSSWMLENLYHDLILVENQIPWIVLQHLFELTNVTTCVHEQETNSLIELVLGFFKPMMLLTEAPKYRPREGHEIKHIVDLLHSCLSSSSDSIIPNSGWHRLPPVADLLQAGIKFKSGTPDDIFNIKFNKGVFEIPPLSIKSNSESLFRNLIAYEQQDRNCTYQFTSYAMFLDYLINTSKDVDVLSDGGILVHALSTEDISLLFNRLYNDTLVHKFFYGEVSRKVYKYYRSRWPKWRTTFKREYCKNPWRISSFIAAILVLVFTFTQTLFSILSYQGFPFSK